MRRNAPDYVYDFTQLPEYITVSEAAMAMRASESFIRTAYKNGDLEIFRYGDTIRISRDAFIDFRKRYTEKWNKVLGEGRYGNQNQI